MELAASAAATRTAFRTVFGGVMVAMFLAAVDQTVLAAALPAIGASFGGFAHLSWVVVAYLLAATITAPLYGHLGDRFGRRRMLLGSLALFTLASALCAAAPTLPALIAARAVQGLGAGGLMTLSQALIGEQLPPRERARFQGYFGALYALSSTLGPVLGGYLTEHVSWRAVFAVNLPLGALAAYLALRIPAPLHGRRGRFRPDVVGALLFCLAASALLFALTSDGSILLLVGVAVAGFTALAWWEQRATDPVIPVRLLAIPAIARSNAMVFCFAAALFAAVLYLPLYLQLGRGFGIGESGLLLLPITVTIAVASTITGRLISATGRLTVYPAAGLALSSAAFATLAVTASTATTPLVLALSIAAAIGLGTVMPASQIIVQDSAGPAALGAATASIGVSRSMGGAFGAALAGALLFGLIGHHDAVLLHGLQGLPEAGTAVLDTLDAAERAALTAHLDAAFRAVFAALAAITALGSALALAVPRRRL